MSTGVIFVYAPALYPDAKLSQKNVFTHGKIIEIKERPGETIVRVNDEKGEWEGYLDTQKKITLSEGMNIRAYGTISTQPDGRNMLACAWIKPTEHEENEFCQRKTRETWEKITQENPRINDAKPFVRPTPVLVKTETPIQSPAKTTANEFISAAEIKVEHEYL